jgi:hypothetical protein
MKTTSFTRAAWLGALALAATGCAGTIKNMREVPLDAAPPAPAPGKAMVVFMRPSGTGYAIQSSVFAVKDGTPQMIGIVAAKAKVAWQADPGKSLFMVVGESGDFMGADLVAGRTYYALVTPRMGMWKARFSLKPVAKAELGSEEFKKWLEDCRWAVPDQSTETWARENADSVRAKYTSYYPKWKEKPPVERPALAPDDGT